MTLALKKQNAVSTPNSPHFAQDENTQKQNSQILENEKSKNSTQILKSTKNSISTQISKSQNSQKTNKKNPNSRHFTQNETPQNSQNKTNSQTINEKTPNSQTQTAQNSNLTPFFRHENAALYQNSALNPAALTPQSVDLIITSPPYNVGIEYGSNDDSSEYESYLKFCEKWLENCFLWGKDGARFCLNIPLDKNKGGQQSVGADLTTLAKKIGWKYHSSIVWNEGNISRRTAWGSWLSASAPYVIAPVELILVLYKGEWKRRDKGVSDICKDEFMAWTNGLWSFNGESKKRVGHPAPFPRELPRRCVRLFSFVGDVVCDPFCGSGTSMIEAFLNGREFVGIEIDSGYCELAKTRFLQAVQREKGLF